MTPKKRQKQPQGELRAEPPRERGVGRGVPAAAVRPPGPGAEASGAQVPPWPPASLPSLARAPTPCQRPPSSPGCPGVQPVRHRPGGSRAALTPPLHFPPFIAEVTPQRLTAVYRRNLGWRLFSHPGPTSPPFQVHWQSWREEEGLPVLSLRHCPLPKPRMDRGGPRPSSGEKPWCGGRGMKETVCEYVCGCASVCVTWCPWQCKLRPLSTPPPVSSCALSPVLSMCMSHPLSPPGRSL